MIKEKLKSVRVKLFLVLCVVTILLVICLIAINSLVLENFYIYNKTNTIREVYNKINKYSFFFCNIFTNPIPSSFEKA